MLESPSPDYTTSRQDRRAGYFFIALTPILTIFLVIPLELYTNAAEYWRWDMDFPGSFMLVGAILYAGLVILLYALSIFSVSAFKVSALALFYLGIYVLLADVLAPLQTGLLDGSALESDEPLFYTLIELLMLGFVLFLAVKLRSHAGKITSLMTAFLLVLSLVYAVYASQLASPRGFDLSVVEPSSPLNGNIYHIVLDEMQTDAARAYIQYAGLQKDLEGFTFYGNNLGNYLFTNVSMPSYLTGKLFRAGDFSEWQESYKEHGLFRRLYEAGFTVDLYSVYDHWCSPYAHSCRSLDEVFEQHTGLLGADFITYVQIWFARISPNFVSNRALSAGKVLGDYVDTQMNSGAQNIPKTISRGRAPYSSVLMLDELKNAEKDKPGGGRYVYAHAILPHGPYVMSESCAYDGSMWKTKGGKQAYYQQARCALDKVIEFLDELKRLGRYRDASIVIHADTGHGHQGFINIDESGTLQEMTALASPLVKLHDKFVKSEEWYLSRGMALLMIKPPGAGVDLVFSNDLSQLIDVYPTILDMAGLFVRETEKLDGRSLLNMALAAPRDGHMYFTTPAKIGEVTALTITDQGNISGSRLIIEDNKPSVERLDHYTVTFGLNDDDIEMTGFSYPEYMDEHSRHWRWATGTTSSVDLSRYLRLEPGHYLMEFELEPFVVNNGAKLGISIGDHRQEVTLEEGWRTYRLQFELQGTERAEIRFDFEWSASPQSLGISADQRKLSARLQWLGIRRAN
jgi:hypothetical protein